MYGDGGKSTLFDTSDNSSFMNYYHYYLSRNSENFESTGLGRILFINFIGCSKYDVILTVGTYRHSEIRSETWKEKLVKII